MTIDKVMMMMMMIAGSREILLYCTVMMKKNERGAATGVGVEVGGRGASAQPGSLSEGER